MVKALIPPITSYLETN